VDNLLDMRPTFGKLLYALFFTTFPAMQPKKDYYLGPDHIPKVSRGASIFFFSLDKDETDSILQEARKQKTTFHGVICAASQFAVCKSVGNMNIRSFCSSAVNLRPYCIPKVDNSQMGDFVAAVDCIHQLEPKSSFWNLARESKLKITEGIEDSFRKNGMLQFLSGDWIAFFKKKVNGHPNGRNETVHTSNIGRMDIQISSKFKLKDLWFVNTKAAEGPVFMVSSITTNGRFSCCMAVPTPVIEEKMAEDYARAMKDAVLGCRKGDFILRQLWNV